MNSKDSHQNSGGQVAIAFNLRGREGGSQAESADLASVRASSGGSSRSYVVPDMAVRRLTVVEVARLQGFDDLYCHIETDSRRKIEADEAEYLAGHGLNIYQDSEGQWFTNIAADGPMYRAYGNSMAVPVIRWIGKRVKGALENRK
jgi:DNA (cytosine-5)-methyltransferase 1